MESKEGFQQNNITLPHTETDLTNILIVITQRTIYLPDELLQAILWHLPDEDLRQLAKVNRQWHNVALYVYQRPEKRLAFYQMAFYDSVLWQHLADVVNDNSLAKYCYTFFSKEYSNLWRRKTEEERWQNFLYVDYEENRHFITGSQWIQYGLRYAWSNSIFAKLQQAYLASLPPIEPPLVPETLADKFTQFFSAPASTMPDFLPVAFAQSEARWLQQTLSEQSIQQILSAESDLDIETKLNIARRYRRVEALLMFLMFVERKNHHASYCCTEDLHRDWRFTQWLTSLDLIQLATNYTRRHKQSRLKFDDAYFKPSPSTQWRINKRKPLFQSLMNKAIQAQWRIRLHLFLHRTVINNEAPTEYEANCLSLIARATGEREEDRTSQKMFWLSQASSFHLFDTLRRFKRKYLLHDLAEDILLIQHTDFILGRLNEAELLNLLEHPDRIEYADETSRDMVLSALHVCREWPNYFGHSSVNAWSDEQIVNMFRVFCYGKSTRKFDGYYLSSEANFSSKLLCDFLFAIGRMTPATLERLQQLEVTEFDHELQRCTARHYGKEILIHYALVLDDKSYAYPALVRDASYAFALMALLLELDEVTIVYIREKYHIRPSLFSLEKTLSLPKPVSASIDSKLHYKLYLEDTLLRFPEITKNFTISQLLTLQSMAKVSTYWQNQDLSLLEQWMQQRLLSETDDASFIDDVIAYLSFYPLPEGPIILRLMQREIWVNFVKRNLTTASLSQLISADFFSNLKSVHIIDLASEVLKSPALLSTLIPEYQNVFFLQLHKALRHEDFLQFMLSSLSMAIKDDMTLDRVTRKWIISLIAHQAPEQLSIWLENFLSLPEAITRLMPLIDVLLILATDSITEEWRFMECALRISQHPHVFAYLEQHKKQRIELLGRFIQIGYLHYPKKKESLNAHPLLCQGNDLATYSFEELHSLCQAVPRSRRSHLSDGLPALYREVFSQRIESWTDEQLSTLLALFPKHDRFSLFDCEAVAKLKAEQNRRADAEFNQQEHDKAAAGMQLALAPKWYRASRLNIPWPIRLMLGVGGAVALCFGLSVLLPWLALPAVMISMAVVCGILALATPKLMAWCESHFALLFQGWDKTPSEAEKVFAQTAPDLPPVARWVSGLLIGFALGVALGILIPGFGWALGGAIGMLVATPLTLAYPLLTIFASTITGEKPKTTPLNLPAHIPVYLRLSAGCAVGAAFGAFIGALIPIPGGTLLGLAIGILVGAGLGYLADMIPPERPAWLSDQDDSPLPVVIEDEHKKNVHNTLHDSPLSQPDNEQPDESLLPETNPENKSDNAFQLIQQ